MTEYLTTAEVAAMLRCSPDYVARQCKQGAIRGRKLGDEWRIPAEAVDEFMAGGNKPPARVQRRRAS